MFPFNDLDHLLRPQRITFSSHSFRSSHHHSLLGIASRVHFTRLICVELVHGHGRYVLVCLNKHTSGLYTMFVNIVYVITLSMAN